MTEAVPDNEDSAWVAIETPFDATELRGFLDDIERLFRINSLLVFDEWRQTGDDRYLLKAKNLSNEKTLETILDVVAGADRVTVTYSSGLKTATSFAIETTPGGAAKLIVTDDYAGTAREEREARLDEVDKSLVQWGRDLHRYLRHWRRWSWLPGWKFYMRRVWQPMKPVARRICFILIMITAAEFVMFLFVVAIFVLELDKYIG